MTPCTFRDTVSGISCLHFQCEIQEGWNIKNRNIPWRRWQKNSANLWYVSMRSSSNTVVCYLLREAPWWWRQMFPRNVNNNIYGLLDYTTTMLIFITSEQQTIVWIRLVFLISCLNITFHFASVFLKAIKSWINFYAFSQSLRQIDLIQRYLRFP
jgi:hypothetical protein